MAISYAEAVANIIPRLGNVFVRQAGTTDDFQQMGVVRSVSVKATKVLTSEDTAGRKVEIGMDFVSQFTMAQTEDTEIAALDTEVTDQFVDLLFTAEAYPGNFAVGVAEANLIALTDNVLIQDVLLNLDMDLDHMGDESGIAMEATYRIVKTDFGTEIPDET
jgi:hypothetical protein